MQEVSAVKCLAVGLVKGNYILISSEYLNLKASQISVNMKYSNSFSTSSVTSGPLLEKSPCLVTDTNVVVSNETASSVSVFLKMM